MNSRNSKIEILRIISITLIVLSHYVVHSDCNFNELPLGVNRIILEFGVLGNIGTMLFVLISGYFLINSNKIKLKKIVNFVAQVSFYSIFIYLILCLYNKESINLKDLLLNCFPITFKRYWFATVYFIIYLFHPFINKFINSLTRDEHKKFILISIFLFFVMSTLTTMDYYGNEIVYFIIFYTIGAYFSKYNDNYIYKNNNSIKILLISSALIFMSIIFFDIIGLKMHFFGSHSTYLLNIHSVFALLVAISLFGIFSKEKQYTSIIVNNISALIFGVYLISDNKYLRNIIWCDLLNNKKYFNSSYLLFHIVISVFIVSCICLIIEYIRKKTFDKLIYSWLDEKIDNVQKKIKL